MTTVMGILLLVQSATATYIVGENAQEAGYALSMGSVFKEGWR